MFYLGHWFLVFFLRRIRSPDGFYPFLGTKQFPCLFPLEIFHLLVVKHPQAWNLVDRIQPVLWLFHHWVIYQTEHLQLLQDLKRIQVRQIANFIPRQDESSEIGDRIYAGATSTGRFVVSTSVFLSVRPTSVRLPFLTSYPPLDFVDPVPIEEELFHLEEPREPV